MNAAMVSRVVSLIPERTARMQSGSAFTTAEAEASGNPERVAYVSRFLQWLTPLHAITKDDQRALGLLSFNGRPVHAADVEADEADLDLEAEDIVEMQAAEDLDDEPDLDSEPMLEEEPQVEAEAEAEDEVLTGNATAQERARHATL